MSLSVRESSGASTSTSTVPSQRDQIRDYRNAQRLRHTAERATRRLFPGRFNRTLESQLNPEAEIRLSQQRRAAMVPAEVLYNTSPSTRNQKVYQHYSEERILCTGHNQQLNLPFINEVSYRALRESGQQHIHIGLIMIRVHPLHRRNTGTTALIVPRDTRWNDDRSIIGTMEVDLSAGSQIVYIAPNMMLSVEDFFRNIQLAIQTQGYENWNSAESNLLISRALIGRLTNDSFTGFQYNISNVAEYLHSQGIQAIEGQAHPRSLGNRWILQAPAPPRSLVPQNVETTTLLDGNVSLRFSNYHQAPLNSASQDNTHPDINEDENQFIGFLFDGEDELEYPSFAPIQEESVFIIINGEEIPDEEIPEDFIIPFRNPPPITPSSSTEPIQELALNLEDQLGELDYPTLISMEKQLVQSSVTSAYNPPTEPFMGQISYPPAAEARPQAETSSSERFKNFRAKPYSTPNIFLPPAYNQQGAILILPDDIGLYEDTISRWESITLNMMNEKIWPSNEAKAKYMENLLGEMEKKTWIQWRTTYVSEYNALVQQSDETQNLLSQVRRIFLLQDPFQGSTAEQDQAYNDLERLSCDNIKDLIPYLIQFRNLAAKSGRLFLGPELSEKLFRKMPALIGKEIEAAFISKHGNANITVMPRIHFTYHYLSELCKKAALQRSLKDLSFCNQIPIPGYYSKGSKKYGLRKARTYKGKPHPTHVRVFKKAKYQRTKKCKCFICGEPGHFARECKKQRGNIVRATVHQELAMPDNFDVVSVDADESDSSGIYSFSENEAPLQEFNSIIHDENIFLLYPDIEEDLSDDDYEEPEEDLEDYFNRTDPHRNDHLFTWHQGDNIEFGLPIIDQIITPDAELTEEPEESDQDRDEEPPSRVDNYLQNLLADLRNDLRELEEGFEQLEESLDPESNKENQDPNQPSASDEDEELVNMLHSKSAYLPQVFIGDEKLKCDHSWSQDTDIPYDRHRCHTCKRETQQHYRLECQKCRFLVCSLCTIPYLGITMQFKQKQKQPENPQLIRELMEHAIFLEEKCRNQESLSEQAIERIVSSEKQVKFSGILPTKKSEKSAGYDLASTIDTEIPPGRRALIPTGIFLQMPDNVYGRIIERSSLAMRGITVQGGVIDPDFTGEIQIILFNHNLDAPYPVKKTARLAQIIFEKFYNPIFVQEPFTPTQRGSSGFGSTDIQPAHSSENIQVISEIVANQVAKSSVLGRLYSIQAVIHISPDIIITTTAIIDTGATVCCISKNIVPENAAEELTYKVNISGISSKQQIQHRLKRGTLEIASNKYALPLCYVIDLNDNEGFSMILGCNFFKHMGGGMRFEGPHVTFYKGITTLSTSYANTGIDHSEQITSISFPLSFKDRFSPLINELKAAGYIGEDPMKHWSKNKVTCKLDLKNTEITIQDKPLRHVTPALEQSFGRHVDALLKLKVIRPSKSRHRTMAFIVNSGTTVTADGKEVKGKERMVFNYKALNDNTYKDQYSLPNIQLILKKVINSNIYSKFDLKSGFHQVAMAPESVEWTAFHVPQGLFEWLAMPFGIKNAPAIFQRKMDSVFKGCEKFLAVYIDDILVFSNNEEEHAKHLTIMLQLCKEHGLVLSPTKMNIAVKEVNFLGATIGSRKVKLQENIIKKILDFNEENLQSKKGLRSFLGILNYARNHIPNLGKIAGPLYSKTSVYGDIRFSASDWKLIKEIKAIVEKLPPLDYPPEQAYIIIESDGCMDGWGAICKWKLAEYDPKSSEQICAYASGKFSPIKSTIDAEITAAMEGLEAFKIHYLDKSKITLRTDCQAIISFCNKTSVHKPSRVRWLKFIDYITNTGIDVKFEHIDAKNNVLADTLSRLVMTMQDLPWLDDPHQEQSVALMKEIEDAPLTIKQRSLTCLQRLICRSLIEEATEEEAINYLTDDDEAPTMSLEEFSKRRSTAHDDLLQKFQATLQQMTELEEALQERTLTCQRFATKDNYWGDWLPEIRKDLHQMQEAKNAVQKIRDQLHRI
nr:polyprotein [Taro bacilliform virus]WIF19196.1 polyprotein [Taro bacilliform virus]